MIGYFYIGLFYAAIIIFVVGTLNRVYNWARSPVPYNMCTTGGQQKSLDWIPRARFDSPYTKLETLGRMIGEVFLFRTLWRNTKYYVETQRQTATKWLWIFAMAFHWPLLIILLRHLRFFTSPVPGFIVALQSLDGILTVGHPELHMISILATDLIILVGLGGLLGRRLVGNKERSLSQPGDWLVLILIIATVISGILMRYLLPVDIEGVKLFAIGIVTFSFVQPPIDFWFLTHLTLVSALLIYFPFSKLVHAVGILFSPTRNMPNDPRKKKYINPWNPPYTGKSYDEYYEYYKDQLDEIAEEDYRVKGDFDLV
ncbi:MAG: sulfate reduction electron transfer complex DsrMKJOP subunit DsrM [Archaeoglobaceae archaeon]